MSSPRVRGMKGEEGSPRHGPLLAPVMAQRRGQSTGAAGHAAGMGGAYAVGTPKVESNGRGRYLSADGPHVAVAGSPWGGLPPGVIAATEGSDADAQVKEAQGKAVAGAHHRGIALEQKEHTAHAMLHGISATDGEGDAFAPPVAKRQPSAASSVASTGSAIVRLTDDEERYEGTVGMDVYWEYFVSLGGWSFLFMFGLLSIALQGAQEGGSVWIALWTGSGRGGDLSQERSPLLRLGLSSDMCLIIYLALGVMTALFSVVRNFAWFQAAVEAGRRMHDLLLGAVLRAPLSFFQTTP